MSEESKEPKEPVLVPDDESIPEKFRGKPLADVIKSYSEAEKAMHSKSEEVGGIKKQLELLQKEKEDLLKKEEPVVESDDDYEYVTKSDLQKLMSEMRKTIEETNESFNENLKKAKEETATQTTWEFEKRQFLNKHPELSPDDAETIALFGLRSGTNTLEESLKAYTKFAGKLGLGPQEQREVSSDSDNPSVQESNPEKGPFGKEWMERAKKGYKSISSTL